jgi:hypothetical protein
MAWDKTIVASNNIISTESSGCRTVARNINGTINLVYVRHMTYQQPYYYRAFLQMYNGELLSNPLEICDFQQPPSQLNLLTDSRGVLHLLLIDFVGSAYYIKHYKAINTYTSWEFNVVAVDAHNGTPLNAVLDSHDNIHIIYQSNTGIKHYKLIVTSKEDPGTWTYIDDLDTWVE